ncbi:MAG: hypothetical protein ACLQFR_12535 [Streptosporangiaceae bacterium]
MISGLGPVGPRGLALLALAGLVSVLLAVHGWSTRGSASALGSIGTSGAAARHPAGLSHSGQSARAGPAAAPTATSGPSAAATGPLLSSQSFASYAFEVWPDTPSQAARAALTGLSVTVHRQGPGISVIAGVIGQAANAPRYYPTGARVYVIEASLGDESGNTDYNLGDDGIIVTDAHGRIVQ